MLHLREYFVIYDKAKVNYLMLLSNLVLFPKDHLLTLPLTLRSLNLVDNSSYEEILFLRLLQVLSKDHESTFEIKHQRLYEQFQ